MVTQLMRFISVIFHPLLLATYSCLILFFVAREDVYGQFSPEGIPYFILVVFITTSVIPGASVALLRITKSISNMDITRREERALPFLTIASFYAITTYMFQTKMHLPHLLLMMMIGVTALIFLIFVISFWFKISVHAAGIWGVAGLFSAINMRLVTTMTLPMLGMLFLIAGLTTSSRIYLNKHNPTESWAGAILGFFFSFLAFYWFA